MNNGRTQQAGSSGAPHMISVTIMGLSTPACTESQADGHCAMMSVCSRRRCEWRPRPMNSSRVATSSIATARHGRPIASGRVQMSDATFCPCFYWGRCSSGRSPCILPGQARRACTHRIRAHTCFLTLQRRISRRQHHGRGCCDRFITGTATAQQTTTAGRCLASSPRQQ